MDETELSQSNVLSAGVNQYGQVVFDNAAGAGSDLFLPPGNWGPFSAPIDLLIGNEMENITAAAETKIRFWKTTAIVGISAVAILGLMYVLAANRDKL